MLNFIFNWVGFISFNDAPQPWQLGFQDSATPGFTGLVTLHNTIGFYLIVISLSVFWALFSIIYYYGSNKNPIAHKYLTHGTVLELIWTITPALILIAIAFPSFRLLYLLDEVISPTLTIKVVGHQWYWSYEYSDFITESGDSIDFDSYMIPAGCIGKTPIWVKLPNSGDALKLMIPNYIRKAISGWTNHSCKVISHKINEKKMGHRGSKSGLNFKSVKEQRVDGSYFGLKNPKLRYTLMGGESRYLVKNPSNQLINRSFSTLNLQSKLNPWEITGFIDAEGSFTITIYPDNRSRLKWAVQPIFTINLHRKDLPILEEIKNTLQLGNIVNRSKSVVSYKIGSKKELKGLIHHLDKYPLVTCKFSDFLLFKQCFEIITKQKHLSESDLLKILGLKNDLNLGLSNKLKESFPNIIPINRPDYVFKGIPNPFWVSGFTSGDGSFYLSVFKQNSKFTPCLCLKKKKIFFLRPLLFWCLYTKIIWGPQPKAAGKGENIGKIVRLNYKICLHIREEEVLKGIFNYLYSSNWMLADYLDKGPFYNYTLLPEGVPHEDLQDAVPFLEKKSTPIYTSLKENTVSLHITKFSDIVNIIVPFFYKYPIIGLKKLDYLDFKKVSELVKTKNHLTSEGYLEIEKIHSQMNQRRPWS